MQNKNKLTYYTRMRMSNQAASNAVLITNIIVELTAGGWGFPICEKYCTLTRPSMQPRANPALHTATMGNQSEEINT